MNHCCSPLFDLPPHGVAQPQRAVQPQWNALGRPESTGWASSPTPRCPGSGWPSEPRWAAAPGPAADGCGRGGRRATAGTAVPRASQRPAGPRGQRVPCLTGWAPGSVATCPKAKKHFLSLPAYNLWHVSTAQNSHPHLPFHLNFLSPTKFSV